MTARERAEERNTKLADQLNDLDRILNRSSDEKIYSKSDFNKIKVIEITFRIKS